MHRCWDPGLVDEYFHVDVNVVVQRQHWGVFEKLHYPIKRMHVLSGETTGLLTEHVSRNGDDSAFIDEQALLSVIETAPPDQNVLIGVRGAAGSGKSHLIRWLEFKLRENDRIRVIPIPRDLNTVTAVLGAAARAAGLEDIQFQSQATLDPGLVVQMVDTTFRLRAEAHSGAERQLLKSGELIPTIRPAIENALSTSQDDREGRLPSVDRKRLADQFKGYTDPDRWEEGSAAFVDLVERYITQAWMFCVLGSADFDLPTFMRRISDACRADGCRPLLLLEDATSFGVLHRELFHFLASLTSSDFITVAGWTTGYETQFLGQENLRDRLRLHLTLSETAPDGTEVTFAFEEAQDAIGLAQRYLDAIRTPCDRHGRGDPYPFTTIALQRFYEHLFDAQASARRFTPRLYLIRVLRPLLRAAALEGRFPAMRDVDYLEPRVESASMGNFRPQYPEWADLMLWFMADGETPTKEYLDDLDVEAPRGLPSAATAPPAVEPSKPEPQVDSRGRRLKEEHQKVLLWLEGGSLLSPEQFTRWVTSALALTSPPGSPGFPSVYGLRFTADTAAAIEGVSAGGEAPGLLRVPRNQAGARVLRGLAYLELYKQYESPAEAAYIHAQLTRWRQAATARLRNTLIEARPVAGLVVTLLNWLGAMSGHGISRRDAARQVQAALRGSRGEGSMLSRGGEQVRALLAAQEPTLRKFLQGMAEAGDHTLDLDFLGHSLDAVRSRAFDASPTRLGREHVGPSLAACAKALADLEQKHLAEEEAALRALESQVQRTPRLGPNPLDAAEALREEFVALRGQGLAVSFWQPIQRHIPLVRRGGQDLDTLMDRFETGIAAALAEPDHALRLAFAQALEPSRVQEAIEAADAFANLAARVRADLEKVVPDHLTELGSIEQAISLSKAATDALAGDV